MNSESNLQESVSSAAATTAPAQTISAGKSETKTPESKHLISMLKEIGLFLSKLLTQIMVASVRILLVLLILALSCCKNLCILLIKGGFKALSAFAGFLRSKMGH